MCRLGGWAAGGCQRERADGLEDENNAVKGAVDEITACAYRYVRTLRRRASLLAIEAFVVRHNGLRVAMYGLPQQDQLKVEAEVRGRCAST